MSLEELLRHCHRHELLPLAEVLGVPERGMGLSTLAKSIAMRLRRQGGNAVWNNLLRGGEGPSYDELLRDLGLRLGVALPADVEEAERLLRVHEVASSVGRLAPEARAEVLAELGLPPDLPDAEAASRLLAALPLVQPPGNTAELAITAISKLPGLLVRRLYWANGCLMLFWWSRPRDEVLVPAVMELAELRRRVAHRVTVGVVGSPSSGKDAAMKAIFGVDTGNVNPVAGSTKEVEIVRLKEQTALYLVNTPGMGDVVESVTEEAKQVLSLIDVFIYVINAQGGVQARELADYRACLASGRPVLAVVNKIDTLRESDRERYLADARQKLGAAEADFMSAAFDPLPVLSESPLGVAPVQAWLEEKLVALGKAASELPWTQAEG